MKYTDNAINILTTMTFKGIGKAWIVKNWGTKCPDVDSILSKLNSANKGESRITKDIFAEKKEQILNILYKNETFIDGVIGLGDANFPQHRGVVKNSERPVFLFYKGDISLLQKTNYNITVIGLLTPDVEIESIERTIVSKLVENNITIVSGLALGCDSIAHIETISCQGKTIAILPSPLSGILPASNRSLADMIVNTGGLLVSEYLTDAKSKNMLSSRYQERDRLQALFSDGIILSASYAKNNLGNDSGSRLAMQYAKDYMIRRAVIYDEQFADNPMFDLNRQYIKEDSSVLIINKTNYSDKIDKWNTHRSVCSQSTLFDL